jgi:hypothetical protein
MGETRNAHAVLMENLNRSQWEDNIRMDFRETRWEVAGIWLRISTTP